MNKYDENPITNELNIDFLYLDLTSCTRCMDTDENLEAALSEVSKLLTSAGITTRVKKTQIINKQQANELDFISSPTLRVNGQDIVMPFKQSRCESCETCACNGKIDCRVWIYQGEEHLQAPKAMIIDAILTAVYAPKATHSVSLSATEKAEAQANLQHFFDGMDHQKAEEPAPCCDTEQRSTCCEAEDKQSCCGTSDVDTAVASSDCGC